MKSDLNRVIKVIGYFVKEVGIQSPIYFFVVLSQTLLKTFQPFITIFFSKLFIDLLMSDASMPQIIMTIMLMFVLNFIVKAILEALKCSNENYADTLARYFDQEIGKKSMAIDYQWTEDPSGLSQKEKARSGISWYTGGAEGLLNIIIVIVSSFLILMGTLSIIMSTAPYLSVLILLTVMISSIFQRRINQISESSFESRTLIDRLYRYVYFDLTDFKLGKDIRLFNGSKLIAEKGIETRQKAKDTWGKQAQGENRYQQIQNLLRFILDVLMMTYIGYLAYNQSITIGTFSMLLASAVTMTSSITALLYQSIDLNFKTKYLNEYIVFQQLPDCLPKKQLPICLGDTFEIEFRNVSFKYPHGDLMVLQNLNLKIESGKRYSIVGLNGAGKTSFVKLVTRLYDVSEGEILINGVDIKQFELAQLHSIYSVVFQDFSLFALSLKENIDPNLRLTELGFAQIIQKAGLSTIVESLPDSYQTNISKRFDDYGFEPSGGEAQKIAIARALAKDAPIVILDEPTSALDPIAESEIYHHLDELIKGKTAIYISHRLSSSRFSDCVLVFDQGRLVEQGAHDSLIKNDAGLYSLMFKTQAQYYN